MSENGANNFRNGVIVALVGAVFGALVTIVGQPYVNQIFEETKTPKLLQEKHSTNIASLPSNVKSQIALITTRYSLRHVGGGAAEQVTITIKSSEEVPLSNLIIDPSSEPNSINEISKYIKKIEIPVIRPTGVLLLEITHSPKNEIEIDEISKIGEVVSSNFSSSGPAMEWWQYLLIGLFFLVWGGFIWFAYLFLSKGAKYFVSLELNSG